VSLSPPHRSSPDLHVSDDANPHREPGTTAAGFLTGAGTAVLAVAAAVLPRLRAGTRAVLVLLIGLLAAGLGAAGLAAELADGGRLWAADLYGGMLVGVGAAVALGAVSGLRRAQAHVPASARVAANQPPRGLR
jgi:hypothetical protein